MNTVVLQDLLASKFDVLNGGHIRLVDVMGSDDAVVQAARVSYGKGTKTYREDRGLIRYLMQKHHTSPFEQCELKFHVRVPMDAWRQWIRHRTACLSGDTVLHFDLPGGIERRGNQLYKLTVKDVFDKFQPTENTQRPDKQGNAYSQRGRVQAMYLRSVDEETGAVRHTKIVDVWESGEKPVYLVTTESGASAKMSADHLCWTSDGWKRLKEFVDLGNGEPAWYDAKIHVIGPGKNTGDRVRDGATTGLSCFADQVATVELIGTEMTYDIEVEGPWHNFSAGGLVVHNSVNEYSTRYSEAIDARQTTGQNGWRSQAKKNKQGSGDFLDEKIGRELTLAEERFHGMATKIYKERLELGVAREQARKDLPLSTFTEAYWKIDLHNLFHFLRLRMDPHAQLEIRTCANIIGEEIVAKLFPLSWEAFVDYRLQSMSLSRMDIIALGRVQRLNRSSPALEQEIRDVVGAVYDSKRELEEFLTKYHRLVAEEARAEVEENNS